MKNVKYLLAGLSLWWLVNLINKPIYQKEAALRAARHPEARAVPAHRCIPERIVIVRVSAVYR